MTNGLDECQRVINEECDVFVGIYAKKYGFVPEGTKTSITALEYETALQAGLPVLAYLLNDKARWPASKVERGDGARRLSEFKTDLQKRHIVSFFSGSDQIAAMVAADLGLHLALNERRLIIAKKLSSDSSEKELRLLNEMRSDRPKDLSVVSRRRVAEQHVTQPLNLDRTCRWPPGQPRLVSRTKPLGRPADDVSVSFWNLADIPVRHLRKHYALAIAVDELNWQIEVSQTCECLNWHRAGQHISTDHDTVHLG